MLLTVPREEKDKQARRRILDAAVRCLATHGWSKTTVELVAEDAGISRGAVQHYYRTRDDLFAAALDHLTVISEMTLPPLHETFHVVDREQYVVDLILDYCSGPVFKAAFQVWSAAPFDSELRARIAVKANNFGRSVYKIVAALLNADDADPRTCSLIQMMLYAACGIGYANVVSDNSSSREVLTETWAAEFRSIQKLPAGAKSCD